MNTLRCEGVYKSFGGIQALANLTISFPPSGVVAIIGPNGAGKTTLINVVTGFLRPEAGQVFLGQSNLTHLSAHQIVRLGMARTFQDLRLISQISVGANIMLARPNQRGERLAGALFRVGVANEEARNSEVAKRFLELVGLEKSVDEMTSDLSYGQQKLLTLACCLATEARVLLFDEPVAGVHPELASEILKLLRTLQEQGKLIVIVEHDISAVRQVADVVVVMDEGQVIAQGCPSEVLERAEILEAYLA